MSADCTSVKCGTLVVSLDKLFSAWNLEKYVLPTLNLKTWVIKVRGDESISCWRISAQIYIQRRQAIVYVRCPDSLKQGT